METSTVSPEPQLDVSLLGGNRDVWSWTEPVQVEISGPGKCMEVVVYVNGREFTAQPEGGSYMADVSLSEGENRVHAVCVQDSGEGIESEPVTFTGRLRQVPTARFELSLEDGKLILDGGVQPDVRPALLSRGDVGSMSRLRAGSIYLLLGLLLFGLLFPFYVMLITSLKPMSEVFAIPPTWVPKVPTLRSYVEVWQGIPLGRFFVNSLIIALGAASLTLVCAVPAGYALARNRFPGRSLILYAILVTQMFSPGVVIIALFKILTVYRLLNTYASLIVTNGAFALAFSLWMLTGFFQSVPKEVEEAARIDGCTTVQVVLRVRVPLAAPGVATTVIYTFILAWNEFIFALTFISSTRMQPLTVGLASFIGRFTVEWNNLMDGSLLATLPVILLFLLVERVLRMKI